MQNIPHWQVLESEQLLDFSPWLRVIRQNVQLANGHTIPNYVLTPGRDYALIVALTEDDQVLVVRQYKHGPERVLFDLPAGYLETPDEDPLAAAQRELLEETGYQAAEWVSLGAYYLDTNRSATCAHLFLATGLQKVAEQNLDDTEMLTHHLVPRAEILPLLQSGGMPGVACPAAWGLAMLHLQAMGRA